MSGKPDNIPYGSNWPGHGLTDEERERIIDTLNSPVQRTTKAELERDSEPQPEAGGDMVTVSRKSNHKLLYKNLTLAQENADLHEQLASQQRELDALRVYRTMLVDIFEAADLLKQEQAYLKSIENHDAPQNAHASRMRASKLQGQLNDLIDKTANKVDAELRKAAGGGQ